jgi:hypothetical protein
MSYNGSGTFVINTTGQPVVTGTVISSSAFNALTADLATGLSTAITKDGQTATTVRIPFAQGINSTLATDATSTSTGSIYTAGGVGIAKALYVGTTANIAGTATVDTITSKAATALTLQSAGTNAIIADTSQNLKFNSGYGSVATAYGCRAWVNFDGSGTVSILASGNVTSITDIGVGNYKINYTTSMVDANYSCSSNAVKGGGGPSAINSVGVFFREDGVLAASIEMYTMSFSGLSVDPDYVMATIVR